MSSRINNLLSHVTVRAEDGDEVRYVKQRLALASIASQFTLHAAKLKQMTLFMMHEMIEGLEGRESTIRMLPSYVYKDSPEKASGSFYALDLGGTNFRVLRVVLDAGKVVSRTDSKFVIPKSALTGTADDLFGFIAKSVRKMMSTKAPEDMTKNVPLGFTFSFPCEQKATNAGTLIKWTKGFSTKGVEGKDVVQLLQAALKSQNVKVDVVALCNDTVGTLIARYFQDEDCQVGVILGTGSNACYFDRSATVTKDATVKAHGDRMTPINMECGNFDSTHTHVLPIGAFDEEMDAATPNKGFQRLEKIVSGMYLGEISRRILVAFAKMGALPAELGTAMEKAWSFDTQWMGMITADRVAGLQFTRSIIKRQTNVDVTDQSSLRTIRDVCCFVRNRAAQTSAVFCSAPLLKTRKQGLASIAVDGSVYEKTPGFQRLYQRNIDEILGEDSKAVAVLQKDGSGIGAAMICALAAHQK